VKLVIIESPFGKRVDGTPCTPQEMAENLVYARACMRDSLRRGDEAPFGSHLIYPQVLDDATPEERKLGMEAGWAWAQAAAIAKGLSTVVAVYIDRGVTPGMLDGIKQHKINGLRIEERRLGGGWAI
jgi:hypothetical protein